MDAVEALHSNSQEVTLIEQGTYASASRSRRELFSFFGSLGNEEEGEGEEEGEHRNRQDLPQETNAHTTILHLRSSSALAYDACISLAGGEAAGGGRMQVCFSTRRKGVCVRVTVREACQHRQGEGKGEDCDGCMLDFEFNMCLPGVAEDAKKVWKEERCARKVVREAVWPKIDQNLSPHTVDGF